MPDQSMRTYLQSLEQQGELIRFLKTVDPLKNMSAIEWRTSKELGKASLFTSIEGNPNWQACSEIIADRRKWAIAFGTEENQVLDEVARRIKAPIAPVPIKEGDRAPVQEVQLYDDEVNLHDLPTMHVSEKDGGRFIASGMAVVKDPETGHRNVSIHRQQIHGPNRTGFLMLRRHLWRVYQKYVARGEPMPVAVVIGAHPSIFYSSGFTTTFGVDEFSVAGGLLGEAVRMVKCKTLDLEVPAEAEIVLEGHILPDNYMEPEGPFGEVPGTYAERGETHVFEVKALTRRKDPIYYGIHCGFPNTDTQSLTALGIEAATLEHIKPVEGGLDIRDVRVLTVSGLLMIVIKMRPTVEGQAKTALMAALSGPYLHPKIAMAVDDDIDASDHEQIIWSMATRVHAERDVVMIPNARVFPLDNVSPLTPDGSQQRIGTKWMIDATIPPGNRARFEKAMPLNYDTVKLEDFLP